MKILLAAALLSCAGPAAGQEGRRIGDLIADLGADEPKTRELAAIELSTLGEKARPALEEAARSADLETRARAREILERLDGASRRERWEGRCRELDRELAPFHAGVVSGAVDEVDAVWIERAGYAAVAEGGRLPDLLKGLLVDESRLEFVLATIEGERVTASSFSPDTLVASAGDGRSWLELQVRGVVSRQMPGGGHVRRGRRGGDSAWLRGLKPAALGVEVIRRWPELHRSSLLIVTRTEADSDGGVPRCLRAGALKHRRREIRAVAAHLLRHCHAAGAVDTALDLLGDADAMVREAARGSLERVAGAPAGTPEELRAWWSGMSDADRSRELSTRYDLAD